MPALKIAPKTKAVSKSAPDKNAALPSDKEFRSLLTSSKNHVRSREIEKLIVSADPEKTLAVPALLAKFATFRKVDADRVAALAIRDYLQDPKSDERSVDLMLEASDKVIARLIEAVDIVGMAGSKDWARVVVDRYESVIASVVAVENGEEIEPEKAEKIQASAAKAREIHDAKIAKSKEKTSAPKAKLNAKLAPKVKANPVEQSDSAPDEIAAPPAPVAPKKFRNIVANPDRDAPPSELATGKVKTVDERNAKALRVAIEAAVREVAERFGMDGKVGKGRLDSYGAVYQVTLNLIETPDVEIIETPHAVANIDNRLALKAPVNQIGSLSDDERALLGLYCDAYDSTARRIARKVVDGPDGARKVVSDVPNLVDRASIFVTRNSDQPFDFNASYECKGAYSYKSSAWMPLGAISELVDWHKPEIARMTDYPQMSAVGDWSGVRDTTTPKLWAIFDKYVVPKIREASAPSAPKAAPAPKPKAKKSKASK